MEVLVRRQEQDRTRHVPVVPRPPSRNVAGQRIVVGQLALLSGRIACLRRDLAGKDPRRDRVDPDRQPGPGHLRRQDFGQSDRPRFARARGKMVFRTVDHARRRRDVDDRARIPAMLLAASLQEREERRGHEVVRRGVGAIHLAPLFERRVVRVEQTFLDRVGGLARRRMGSAPDPGVVDQNVKTALAGLDRANQTPVASRSVSCLPPGWADVLDTVFVADIPHERHDLAINVPPMHIHHRREFPLGPPHDVDLGSVHRKSLCGHQANARTTASDQSDLQKRESVYLDTNLAWLRAGKATLFFTPNSSSSRNRALLVDM